MELRQDKKKSTAVNRDGLEEIEVQPSEVQPDTNCAKFLKVRMQEMQKAVGKGDKEPRAKTRNEGAVQRESVSQGASKYSRVSTQTAKEQAITAKETVKEGASVKEQVK